MTTKQRKSGIVRVSKRDSSYTILDPYFLSDERLTWKSKGLLGYLLSKPSNWRVYISDLVKRSKDGKDAVYSALRELEAAGYIDRKQTRENGRITGYETIVYERPIVEYNEPLVEPNATFPLTENPDMGESDAEEPTQVINDLNNNDLKRKINKSAHIPDEDEAVLHTLTAALTKLPLNDTASLYDHYFEDIYAMLTRRFGDRLEPEVIALAADRYFDKAVDLRTGLPKDSVYSPVGLFHDVYTEALAEWKALRYKRSAGG
ncbi:MULTISPECIES: helix-turn-helix domain-containing protein [unclassified Paenibacillus]|uniref:helix-turn-helix domain-containing protein n=1 Tax=unclassified Paenibacillus TaxID=185978 RepID=UPI0030F6AAC3